MRQSHLGQMPDGERDGRQDSTEDVLDRLTVSQAAERLGVTQDAIRKRIARGTIRHGKEPGGHIFVYLDIFERESNTAQGSDQDQASETLQDAGQDKYTRNLEDQIDFLRRELERKDTIIMSLTQRVPELEAAPETRDVPVSTSEGADSGRGREGQDGQHEVRRSWWRRLFEG